MREGDKIIAVHRFTFAGAGREVVQQLTDACRDGLRGDVGKFLLHSPPSIADKPDITQRQLRLRRKELNETALRKAPHEYVVQRLGHVAAY